MDKIKKSKYLLSIYMNTLFKNVFQTSYFQCTHDCRFVPPLACLSYFFLAAALNYCFLQDDQKYW